MITANVAIHLPVLQVVIPLLFATICILIGHRLPAWLLAFMVSWLSFCIACLLLFRVLSSGEISYAIGGWAAPWGIEYRLDILNAFVLVIISAIFAVVITFSQRSIAREIADDRLYLFYGACLLHLGGLLGVIITGDAFNLFVFIEIASLSGYALISLSQNRQALLAAYKYLILGTIGASFILAGVGLLYMMTGTLNMADLSERLPAVQHSRTIVTAFAFLTTGICIKFALFPLHYWLPNVYTFSPSVVSTLLAGTTSKVFIYVFLRFIFSIFGVDYVFGVISLDYILIGLALLAIFSGSLIAIYQNNIKRMLAYSSIAQVGYITLAIGLVSVTGLTAGLVHLFNHSLIKTTLFMTVACFIFCLGSGSLSDLKGAGRAMPWTMLAFVIAGCSLIGIPMTVGFISKWYLILAVIEHDWWWLAVLILASSLLTALYIWKVVEVLYFQPASPNLKTLPWSCSVPLWAMVIANLYFGIHATFTVGIASRIASFLFGT